MSNLGKCSICGKEYKEVYERNNAWPLRHYEYKPGDCCAECNSKYVIPFRETMIHLNGYLSDKVLFNINENLWSLSDEQIKDLSNDDEKREKFIIKFGNDFIKNKK